LYIYNLGLKKYYCYTRRLFVLMWQWQWWWQL